MFISCCRYWFMSMCRSPFVRTAFRAFDQNVIRAYPRRMSLFLGSSRWPRRIKINQTSYDVRRNIIKPRYNSATLASRHYKHKLTIMLQSARKSGLINSSSVFLLFLEARRYFEIKNSCWIVHVSCWKFCGRREKNVTLYQWLVLMRSICSTNEKLWFYQITNFYFW